MNLKQNDMEYYILCGHKLARRKDDSLGHYEWLVNGEWKEDAKWSLALNDARMDYGDYSVSDQDHIKPEIAEELIQNGTVILQGDVGDGTSYRTPAIVKLSYWKKLIK